MTHLFGVLEVLEERLLVPGDALVDVGSGVGEALGLTSLATEDTVAATSTLDLPCKTWNTHPWRLGPTLWGPPASRVWH